MTTSTLSFEQNTTIKVVNDCDESDVDQRYQGDFEEGEVTSDELEEGEIPEPVIKIEPETESTKTKETVIKVEPTRVKSSKLYTSTKLKVWKCPQCNLAICDCVPLLVTSSDDSSDEEENKWCCSTCNLHVCDCLPGRISPSEEGKSDNNNQNDYINRHNPLSHVSTYCHCLDILHARRSMHKHKELLVTCKHILLPEGSCFEC
jgi:hypothetical protein